jgi:NAD(P)-dependent dehydrogenase (short-subunit alcohol dehydrogenase family)
MVKRARTTTIPLHPRLRYSVRVVAVSAAATLRAFQQQTVRACAITILDSQIQKIGSTVASMTFDMTGSTALVTGSTSGIGAAIATTLAARGAYILVCGRHPDRGDDVVAGIRQAGGQADYLRADLGSAESARDLAARARQAAGGVIDILVNNAAVGALHPTAAFPEDDFDAVIATNLKAPFYLVGELAPQMAARRKGAIVNVSSMAGQFALPGMSVYGASKAGLLLLTKSWAAEYGPHGVRVNAVIPGPTRTSGSAALGDALDHLAAHAPAGRVADPSEVAAAVAFLAGDSAGFIHGAALSVDGGRTAV